jgi:hypothetical protein
VEALLIILKTVYIPHVVRRNIDHEDIEDKRLIFIEEQRGPDFVEH